MLRLEGVKHEFCTTFLLNLDSDKIENFKTWNLN